MFHASLSIVHETYSGVLSSFVIVFPFLSQDPLSMVSNDLWSLSVLTCQFEINQLYSSLAHYPGRVSPPLILSSLNLPLRKKKWRSPPSSFSWEKQEKRLERRVDWDNDWRVSHPELLKICTFEEVSPDSSERHYCEDWEEGANEITILPEIFSRFNVWMCIHKHSHPLLSLLFSL